MAKMYDLTPSEYVISSVMKGEDYFNGPVITPTIYFKEGQDVIRPITKDIEKLIEDVHNSNAIPSTMKMYHGRQLSLGGYVVIPEFVTPPVDDSTTV